MQDIRRKLPWYVSDFTDAVHIQSVATIFFMYFACLTPIVTFGLLLGQATGNNMVRHYNLYRHDNTHYNTYKHAWYMSSMHAMLVVRDGEIDSFWRFFLLVLNLLLKYPDLKICHPQCVLLCITFCPLCRQPWRVWCQEP